MLARLQQEYSKKLLVKQGQIREDLSRLKENSDEIASKNVDLLALSYFQGLDERDYFPLMPREKTI